MGRNPRGIHYDNKTIALDPPMKTVLCLSLLLIANVSGYSQWVLTDGPYGIEPTSMVGAGRHLFASTAQGLFHSSDGGAAWNAADPETPPGDGPIAWQRGHLFVSRASGIWTSADSGSTWALIPGGRGALLTAVGDTLFVARSNALTRTTNMGITWDTIQFSQPHPVRLMTSSGRRIYALSGFGLLASSSDAGMTWTVSDTLFPRFSMKIAARDSIVLVASGRGLFRSGDAGLSAARFSGFLPADSSVSSVGFCGSLAFAWVGNSFYRSDDAGLNWTRLNIEFDTPLPSSIYTTPGKLNLFYGDSDSIYAGTATGIYRTGDKGIHWMWRSYQLGRINPLLVAAPWATVDRPDLFVSSNVGRLFRSLDAGRHWQAADTGISRGSVNWMVRKGDTLFVATDAGRIFRSVNGGSQWTRSETGLLDTMNAPYLATDGRMIYIGGGNNEGCYRSSDGGDSWARVDTGGSLGWIFTMTTIGDQVVAGTLLYEVLYSTDHGVTWQRSNWTDPGNGQGRWALAYVTTGNRIFASSCTGSQADGLIQVSSDSGAHWSPVVPGEGYFGFISGIVWQGGSLYCAASGTTDKERFVGRSDDSGATWVHFPIASEPNATGTRLGNLASDGNHLFVGSSEGLWSRPLSELVTSLGPTVVPRQPTCFSLDQNYPNPFNPKTGVRFEVLGASNVKLVVYDLLGREVAVLVNERKAPGSYEATFDGSGLASGVYIYRMTAGSFVQTRTMVLLK
jgi:photosystem II stability/assembly factor-like uncharacterized protein